MTLDTRTETLPVTERSTGEPVGLHEVGTITIDGRSFASGGAHIDPSCIVAYAAFTENPAPCGYYTTGDFRRVYPSDVEFRSWDGSRILARGHVTGCWKLPRTAWASRMYSYSARLDPAMRAEYPALPIRWVGRGTGNGMIVRLRPAARAKRTA